MTTTEDSGEAMPRYEEWGVRWSQCDRSGRVVAKERVFATAAARDRFAREVEQRSTFVEFIAWLG